MDNLPEKLTRLLDCAIKKKSEDGIRVFVTELVNEYYADYVAIAQYYLRKEKKDYARDVVQEMMVNLLEEGHQGLVKLKNHDPLIAKQLRFRVIRFARNHGRKATERNSLLTDPQDAKNERLYGSETFQDRIEVEDEIEYYRQILNPTEREIMMAKAKGFSHLEVSKKLGITPCSCRQILRRARNKLRRFKDLELG